MEPFAGIAYVGLSSARATEQGRGGAGLSARVASQQTVYSTLGLRAAASLPVGGHRLTPSASFGWQRAFADTGSSATMRLLAGGTPFRVEGLPTARDTLKLGAGLGYAVSDRAMLQLNYTGQIAAYARQNAVSGRFSLRF